MKRGEIIYRLLFVILFSCFENEQINLRHWARRSNGYGYFAMVVYQSSWTVLQITKSFHFFRYSSKDMKLLRVQIKSHQTHSYCARVRNVVHRTIYTQTVRPGTVRNVTIDKSPWFWFCSQCEYLKGYKFDFLQDHKLWKKTPEKCKEKTLSVKIFYFCLINFTDLKVTFVIFHHCLHLFT